MKAKKMRRCLRKLGYRADPNRGKGGSHTWLVCEGRPDVLFAFHDKVEIGSVMVRKILVQQVGLTLEEAKEAARNA